MTTFRNPLADPLGTRRGPPLVRGPQFENRWPSLPQSPDRYYQCKIWANIKENVLYIIQRRLICEEIIVI